MKKTITLLSFIFITPAVWSQEVCQNYDYQELKDMSPQTLVEEYCKVSERLEKNANSEATCIRIAEGDLGLARTVQAMGNGRKAREYQDSASKWITDAGEYGLAKKVCADQQERILRVLAVKAKRPDGSVPVCSEKR